jgi:RHS repeat-associated protein
LDRCSEWACSVIKASYDAANQLTGWNEAVPGNYESFAYDDRGNCIRIDKPSGNAVYFSYNDTNLVTEIKYPGGQTNRFWYDALMRRYAMEDSSGLSYFTWDANGMNLLAERDSTGSVTAYYTHGYTPVDGIGSMVAAKKNAYSATYYQYPVYDHRGTVVRLLDGNGGVSAYYEYDAWGNMLKDQTTAGISENRFRYQSNWIEMKDSSGKLYLSPSRLYHAGSGRFLGRDFLQPLVGSYQYAQCSPLRWLDADGKRDLFEGDEDKPRIEVMPDGTLVVYDKKPATRTRVRATILPGGTLVMFFGKPKTIAMPGVNKYRPAPAGTGDRWPNYKPLKMKQIVSPGVKTIDEDCCCKIGDIILGRRDVTAKLMAAAKYFDVGESWATYGVQKAGDLFGYRAPSISNEPKCHQEVWDRSENWTYGGISAAQLAASTAAWMVFGWFNDKKAAIRGFKRTYAIIETQRSAYFELLLDHVENRCWHKFHRDGYPSDKWRKCACDPSKGLHVATGFARPKKAIPK